MLGGALSELDARLGGGPRDAVMALGTSLFLGLIVGLGVGSLNRITLVETLSWKWKQFWKRTIPGSIGGLIFGVITLILSVIREPSFALEGVVEEGDSWVVIRILVLIFVLFVVLIFAVLGGLVTGLVGGWTDTVKVGKAYPNQGIKLSRGNSLAPFLVTLSLGGLGGLICGLIFGLMDEQNPLKTLFWDCSSDCSRADLRSDRWAKSRWFCCDQALRFTTDSLAERLCAFQVC